MRNSRSLAFLTWAMACGSERDLLTEFRCVSVMIFYVSWWFSTEETYNVAQLRKKQDLTQKRYQEHRAQEERITAG